MATVVNTFDLYNTTKYWTGYRVEGFSTEQSVASAFYITQFSSNPVGSQIDFFRELAGESNLNPVFSVDVTIDELPYLWGKYWWDQAVYYSLPIIYNTLASYNEDYYQPFSESVGSLCYLSRMNTLQNTESRVYNELISSLLIPDISSEIDGFYSVANSLFLTNSANIGPGTGTDTAPGSGTNGTLIQPDTDLGRRITANLSLSATINSLYPKIYTFLPFNTTVIGNNMTPYYWSLSANCEETNVRVDFTNNNISERVQLTIGDLIAY